MELITQSVLRTLDYTFPSLLPHAPPGSGRLVSSLRCLSARRGEALEAIPLCVRAACRYWHACALYLRPRSLLPERTRVLPT